MYSNKDNVNILTALLVKHGVEHVVVCPGSRNAPLVHNFAECPDIECHLVTDERSAAFVALGMRQMLHKPVAVCVTSGTALLNTLPAVAESSYQKQGIIIISADRPQQWIGQLDGQTLPQHGALGSFVSKSVTLPEPKNDDELWYCNRLVCEALMEVCSPSAKSVHINVPITELNLTPHNIRQLAYYDMLTIGDIVEYVKKYKSINYLPRISYRNLSYSMIDWLWEHTLLQIGEFSTFETKFPLAQEHIPNANRSLHKLWKLRLLLLYDQILLWRLTRR